MSETRPSVRRGVFFSFEGVDGSGKSTQARLLAEALERSGERVVSVREPGGTLLGEDVRSILLNTESQITARAEALLFAAARAQLVETVIEPALAAGVHVIADRYVDSTSAYQGGGRKLGGSVDIVSAFATGGRLPDCTYLVSLTLKAAAERRSARNADRMEQSSDAFHERVVSVYEDLASTESTRIVSVDGSLPVNDLHVLILYDAWSRVVALAAM